MIRRIARKIKKKTTAKKVCITKSAGRPKKISMKDLSTEELNAMIAQKAFKLFEKQGYSHGNDQGNWYEAEKLVKKSLIK